MLFASIIATAAMMSDVATRKDTAMISPMNVLLLITPLMSKPSMTAPGLTLSSSLNALILNLPFFTPSLRSKMTLIFSYSS